MAYHRLKLFKDMRLKKVTLTNFRCFERLEIDFHDRLTVFVADNAGGKTSLLDGIATGLSSMIPYLSTPQLNLKPKSDRSAKDPEGNPVIEVTASDNLDSSFSWKREWIPSVRKWRAGGHRQDNSAEKNLISYCDKVLDGIPSGDYLMPVFAYYRADRDAGASYKVDVNAIRNKDFPTRSLLGALDALADFNAFFNWFFLQEADEFRENRESADKSNAVRSPALELVRKVIGDLTAGCYVNPRVTSTRDFVVDSVDAGKPVEFSRLSHGYRRVVSIAADFARRLALGNSHLFKLSNLPPGPQAIIKHILKEKVSTTEDISPAWAPTVMLIDEIDLHLHPSWQQRVLGDLMRAFPGTQFIVTTHSPQVLTTVRKENIRIVEKDTNGKWVAKMPEHSPLSQESGDALASVMGVNPIPVRSESQRDLLDTVHDYEQLIRGGMEGEVPAMAAKSKLDGAGYEIPEASLALWRFMGEKVKQRNNRG